MLFCLVAVLALLMDTPDRANDSNLIVVTK